MVRTGGLTKVVAIAGTSLLWLPVALMVVLMAQGVSNEVGLLPFFVVGAMDVFPLVVLGGCLLLWATLRACSHRRVVAWSLAAPLVSTVSGIVWSQPIPIGGWSLVIMTGLLIVYWLGLVLAGAAGTHLVRSLFSRSSVQTA
jgi:hypothetical protein